MTTTLTQPRPDQPGPLPPPPLLGAADGEGRVDWATILSKLGPLIGLVFVVALFSALRFNTFFRLDSPGVIAKLRESYPDLPERPDPRTVFLKLRELRNSW